MLVKVGRMRLRRPVLRSSSPNSKNSTSNSSRQRSWRSSKRRPPPPQRLWLSNNSRYISFRGKFKIYSNYFWKVVCRREICSDTFSSNLDIEKCSNIREFLLSFFRKKKQKQKNYFFLIPRLLSLPNRPRWISRRRTEPARIRHSHLGLGLSIWPWTAPRHNMQKCWPLSLLHRGLLLRGLRSDNRRINSWWWGVFP